MPVIWDDEVRDESGRIVHQADDQIKRPGGERETAREFPACPQCGAKHVHTQFCKYLGKVRLNQTKKE